LPPTTRAAARAAVPAERAYRDALAQFATGVTVICARAPDGTLAGFTANSFNSVSLDPPLIVWSLARSASNLAAFEQAEGYVINVLADDQTELARRFASPHADRFAGVDYTLGPAGAPRIAGCVAWFECRHHSRQHAGDHVLFIGRVEAFARHPGAGLVFHHGRYGTTRPLE
jgi:flavin reductase (DIM6/NTAB) family NADH-FMN oxidoreductase RutF